MHKTRLSLLLAGGALLAITAGCATTGDRKVDISYEPTAHVTGGSGDLYLAGPSGPAPNLGNQQVQWVIGQIKDSDGKKVGNVVTDTMPADLVVQAFSREMEAAGYKVIPVKEMPREAAKGIALENVVLTLDELSRPLTEAKSSAKISAQIWRNGQKVSKTSYEAFYGDSGVDRDRLMRDTLKAVLQNLMQRAVPELVKVLEQK